MEHLNTNATKTSLKSSQLLNQFLEIKRTNRTLVNILFWWEGKRLLFNLMVLTIGVLCYLFQNIMTASDFVFSKKEILIFIVLYNICYSGLCLVEFLIPKNKTYAPSAFKNALFICASVISIPTLFHTVEHLIF